LGPKDIASNEVRVVQRFDGKKYQLNQTDLAAQTQEILNMIQKAMFVKAKEALDSRLKRASNWSEFMHEINQQNTVLTLW
jgi:prolyl-tRNA synthetase